MNANRTENTIKAFCPWSNQWQSLVPVPVDFFAFGYAYSAVNMTWSKAVGGAESGLTVVD